MAGGSILRRRPSNATPGDDRLRDAQRRTFDDFDGEHVARNEIGTGLALRRPGAFQLLGLEHSFA